MIETDKIKVGILLPTFNRKTYLEKALKSAREQTFNNIEIIVIDNGSTDRTAEYMASISDARVRYVVNEKNIGMIGSINKGIGLFSDEVEWCTILGDDDSLDRDFVITLLRTAIASAAKSIVQSQRIFIDKQGNRIREAIPSPQEESAFDYLKMRAQCKRETYLTGVLFNRNAFREIKGYPVFSTGLASDDAFIFALSLKDRLLCDRNAVAYVRIHEEAESRFCFDGVRKLQTIRQFDKYCKKVTMESGTFEQKQFSELGSAFKKYLRVLSQDWWLKAAQCIFNQGDTNQEQLSELLAFVRNNRDYFTFRIKFAVACKKLTGILPEKYAGYRACWENIISFSQFLRKKILLREDAE